MSVSFDISCSTGRYPVIIGGGLFAGHYVGRTDDLVVICDERFGPMVSDAGLRFLPMAAREDMKSLDRMSDLIIGLRRLGVSRSTHILALGGGIVQDAAAFCATIYMRGLDYTYMPTTLLGMVDSCIGGKSSINVGSYKNLVGSILPPTAILIDPCFAETLSAEQRVDGLCEAVKICYCRGGEAFQSYMQLNPGLDSQTEILTKTTSLSLEAKKWFIEADEFDRGPRLLLNFGHTFGHALEGASHFRVSHGVAVGLGILCAIAFGEKRGRDYRQTMPVQQLRDYIRTLLAAVDGLAGKLAGVTVDQCFETFLADKKHRPSEFAVIAIDCDGAVERLMIDRTAENEAHIRAAFAHVLEENQ